MAKLNRNDSICDDCIEKLKGDDRPKLSSFVDVVRQPCQLCNEEGYWLPARKIFWPQEIYDEMVKK